MQLLPLHALGNTDTSTSTALLEDSTVSDPLVQACLLEALLRDVNPGRACRFLQHTNMVLPKVGEIVRNEIRLPDQRCGALGVKDLHLVGVEIQHQAEIVPDIWRESRLPKGLLRASGAGAQQEKRLCVFFRSGVAAIGSAGADSELICGVVLVLDPDQLVFVAVVQGAGVVGLQAEVESLDPSDAVRRVGGLGLEFCPSEADLSVVGRGCEDGAVADSHLDCFGAAVVEERALSSGETESVCPRDVCTKDIGWVVWYSAIVEGGTGC